MGEITSDSTASPASASNNLTGIALKSLLAVWFIAVTVAAFVYAPPAAGFRNESLARMIFFHVPNSIIGIVVSTLSAVYAILYLVKRRWIDDARSYALACQAGLFWFLTTITGAEFAKVQWGTYWNWDPKQSAIFLLLLAYLAYFALRAAVTNPDSRGVISSGYMILAAVITPLLTYVLPNNAPDSLHPKGVVFSTDGMDAKYHLVFWSAVLGFGGLSYWLFTLQMRVETLSRALDLRLSTK
jgi:heme exporter protein C